MRMTALQGGLGAGVNTRFVAREDPPVRIIGEDIMREAGSIVRAVHRGGLVLCPLAAMAISVAGRVSRSRRLLQALFRLLDWDFSVPYGRHAYNLVMLAERVE